MLISTMFKAVLDKNRLNRQLLLQGWLICWWLMTELWGYLWDNKYVRLPTIQNVGTGIKHYIRHRNDAGKGVKIKYKIPFYNLYGSIKELGGNHGATKLNWQWNYLTKYLDEKHSSTIKSPPSFRISHLTLAIYQSYYMHGIRHKKSQPEGWLFYW